MLLSDGALPRKLLAECLGTALLLAVVVGSGVMGERLAGGNAALALLANTLATMAGLYALIQVFSSASGAHFNPLVTLALARRGAIPRRWVALYAVAQGAGAVVGAAAAHAMFDLAVLQVSTRVREGPGQWLAEAVATFGLLLVVLRAPKASAAGAVAAYIGAAYWFTSSTSFANPAAVAGRMLSDTFAGIAPASAPAFIAAEVAGMALALLADRALGPAAPEPTPSPIPHPTCHG